MIEYDNNKYYLASEVAEIMKTNVVSVRNLIHTNKLPAKKIGRSFYVADFEITKYFENIFGSKK